MRILGVDPGLRVTGYGVVDHEAGDLNLVEAGIITTEAKDGVSERLHAIHQGIQSVLKDLKPDIMVLEKLYSDYRHPTTAILMGHARGVICLASGEAQTPLVNMPSTRVKKAILSNGHASKLQINRAVQGILGLKQAPKPLDVSDALAIAISYAWMRREALLETAA